MSRSKVESRSQSKYIFTQGDVTTHRFEVDEKAWNTLL